MFNTKRTSQLLFKQAKSRMGIKHFCEKVNPLNEELKEVNNISEFKQGLTFLSEGKFERAESHLKECLTIFKNINQTESYSYIFVMKKYIQALFYLRKFEECEKTLKASIDLSKNVFKNNPELTFPYYRNLIAFYTYTNITKASVYIDDLLQQSENDKTIQKHAKYFSFAAGAIKLLNNEYNSARSYLYNTMEFPDLPVKIQAYNLHNLALLNLEMKRDYEFVESEELKQKWSKQFNFPDSKLAEKESFVYYKQALAKLELEDKKDLIRNEGEVNLLREFLYSQNEIPDLKAAEEEVLIKSFKNSNSGLTMTNIAEMFFEKGNEKNKQTAFWLKAGIKHYENYEKENIARHLIVFALFYSQLGQTLYAEGLYRKSIELLKNNYFGNLNYNLVFALNMYGRLLMRLDKREREAEELLKKSEAITEQLPFWYYRMVKTRYLDFDFD